MKRRRSLLATQVRLALLRLAGGRREGRLGHQHRASKQRPGQPRRAVANSRVRRNGAPLGVPAHKDSAKVAAESGGLCSQRLGVSRVVIVAAA